MNVERESFPEIASDADRIVENMFMTISDLLAYDE